MNLSGHNEQDRNASVNDAERLLRLIASLPAPVGIEDRVKGGLRGAGSKTGVIGWPAANRTPWTQSWYMRAAAAAAIVFVVAGGGWGVHARFHPAPEPAARAVPQQLDRSGGLSPAAAMRTPKTLQGPRVAVPGKAGQQTERDSGLMKKSSPRARRREIKNQANPAATLPLR